MNRILVAEDEPRVAAVLDRGLRAHGFVPTLAADGVSASTLARDDDFDLLILDLGLTGLHGLGVLKAIRERGESMPVLILTATDEVSTKIAGLEGGADDYVTKPFVFDELLARVRARLRDRDRGGESAVLRVAGIELDLRTRRLTVDGGRPQDLSGREFALLQAFMRNRNQVLSREQLLSRVWGYDFDPGSNVVDVYVGYLRRKLGPDRIKTMRGAGYRFVC